MHKYFVSYCGIYEVEDRIKGTIEEHSLFLSDIVEIPCEVTDENSLGVLERLVASRRGLNSVIILFFKEMYDE